MFRPAHGALVSPLVEDMAAVAADVLEQVRPLDPRVTSGGTPGWESVAEPVARYGDDERLRIAALLGAAPVAADELVRQSGLPAALVQDVLLELELAGRIERHAGARVSRVG